MDLEVRYRNFCSLVFFFLASMFGLVLSGDLVTLFIFWDLLGFSSFFLVVYYRSKSVVGGGLITACTNRLGDCFLFCLLGCTFVFCSVTSLLFCVLLILASMTKSALLPFSSWLPSAMSAPTPVSALVHSSTLVTAGVYLLFRFQAYPSQFLTSISLLTLMYAGLCACLERDLKKVVALSTLSHLGIIMFRIRASNPSLAFLHLNYHAYFKSLLFLGVGTLIHACYGSQERRYPLVMSSGSPLLWVGLITPMLSLCGLIFMTGWASKDLILESIYNSTSGLCSLGALYTSIGLSVGYCVSFVYSTLSGASFGPSMRSVGFSVYFALPVIVLSFGSAVMGNTQCLWPCNLVSITSPGETFIL
jgi:NADH-ubiquinone oxidoreductase chain 5